MTQWAFASVPLLLAGSLLSVAATASTAVPEQLYNGEVIVTGKGEEERLRGFREGIQEIVRKLTGDYALEIDRRLAPILADPAHFIDKFSYEDRTKNIPVHDEQGRGIAPFSFASLPAPQRLTQHSRRQA